MSTNKEDSYSISAYFFIKLISIIYFISFLSLSSQIIGLIGAHGIEPSLFGLLSNNSILQAMCSGGVLISIFLFFGFLPNIFILVLWFFYLLINNSSEVFFNFPWDLLLLEVSIVSFFLCPLSLKIKSPFEVNKYILFLFRIILFKVTFFPAFYTLKNINFLLSNKIYSSFYYAQSLPQLLSFYIFQLPEIISGIFYFLILLIQITYPFLIFSKRKHRLTAALLFFIINIFIMFIGNYSVSSLLNISLILFLIDDEFWMKSKIYLKKEKTKYKYFSKFIYIPILVTLTTLNILYIGGVNNFKKYFPSQFITFLNFSSSFKLVNLYNELFPLFSSHTEVVFEGSNDGKNWKEYRFKFKIEKENNNLYLVYFLDSRLSRVLYYLGQNKGDKNNLIENIGKKLLEGNKSVLSLIEKNPFLDHPPKQIRTIFYDYKFTDFYTARATGYRWTRREI